MRSSCHWRDLYLTSELIDSTYQSLDYFRALTACEVSGAQVLVLGSVFEHVAGSCEHGGGDREYRFLGAAAGAQALELRL